MSGFGQRRVVVTGLGVVSSLGHDTDHVFDAICRGESGIRPIRRFDVAHCPVKIGGVIEGFDAESVIQDRDGRRMLRLADWVQTLSLCATELASRDARIDAGTVDPERLGVFLGAGRGGAEIGETLMALILETSASWAGYRDRSADTNRDRVMDGLFGALKRIRPTGFLQQCPTFVSAYVSIRHHARGPMLTNVNLCSAGAQAIGEAAWVVGRGDADVMITGGADSMLNAVELTAFSALDAVSGRNEEGTEACKPFDLRRDGCVVGEGAAALVLEELEHARRRGAHVYAEVLGYGTSSDAYKMTAPPEDARGAILAMRRALAHARVAPDEVGHVNAHGTATILNDRVETDAIKAVFGRHAYRMPIVSTKSMTGHLIAAAGALEALVAIKCLAEKRIPPTRNLRVRDPRCDLDYVPEGQRALPGLRVVLSNSFAIGGSNACLLFGELPHEPATQGPEG